MIVCESYFKKNFFESYSEFYLALCIASELGRRGTYLDLSTMRIEKDILPELQLTYFKYLVGKGYIKIGDSEPTDVSADGVHLYLDMSFIENVKDLFIEREDRFVWEYDECNVIYNRIMMPLVRNNLMNISALGNSLLHLVAVYLMGIHFGDIPKKPLHIELSYYLKKSSFIYVNILSCIKTLDWFKDLVYVDVDFSEFKDVDMDYAIFFNNSKAAKRYKKWSINEKRDIMKRLGINVGSILVLWKRKGMCDTNPAGRLVSSIIVRIDEIGRDFIGVRVIPISKTKEEVKIDFESIPKEKRYLFTDMLEYRLHERNETISLYEVGIEGYFFEEYQILTKIDKREITVKRITVDGKESDVSMNNVEAIYWLLCEYGVDFDRELYRNMYNDGKQLMWDMYGVDE